MHSEKLTEDIGSISGRPRNRKPFREDLAINKVMEENMTLKDTVDEQRKELIRLRALIAELRRGNDPNC
jgi:hypothetical protein